MADDDQQDSNEHDGRWALADLFTTPGLPPRLRRRIEASLESGGLLRPAAPARRNFVGAIAALAASVAGFATGVTVGEGRRSDPAESSESSRFAFLLLAPAAGVAPVDDVEEHRQWAASLIRAGHRVSGEALAEQGTIVDASDTAVAATDGAIAGLFIVSASDQAEALRIAKTLPHVIHGGQVVVRRVIPT